MGDAVTPPGAGPTPVANATAAAKTPAATKVAAEAAKPVVATARTSTAVAGAAALTGKHAGKLGAGAGAVGLLYGGWAVLNDVIIKDQSLSESLDFAEGVKTAALGAGLLTASAAAPWKPVKRVLQGGAAVLVLAGLIGSLTASSDDVSIPGAIDPAANPLAQAPRKLSNGTDKPTDLEAVELATGRIPTTKGETSRPSLYVDTSTAKQLKAKSLAFAYDEARALVQGDAKKGYRSQAIVRTSDGKLWAVQLAGD